MAEVIENGTDKTADNPLDEFTSTPSEAFDIEDANFFGNFDIDNLPEFENGTYWFKCVDVNWSIDTSDEAEADKDLYGLVKVNVTVVWSMNDETSPLYKETIRQWFTVYPTANDKKLPPAKAAEVRDSIKKLKKLLKGLKMEGSVFNLARFKREMVDKVEADIYISVSYKEETDTTYKNIRQVSRRSDSSTNHSTGFGFSDI